MESNEVIENSPEIEKKKGKSFFQLIKFALVGASNTVVDMIVSTGLSFVLNLIRPEGVWIVFVSKAVGYFCGILNSYFWNSRWTFREERRRDLREKLSFLAVNLVVLAVSFGLITLFSDVFKLSGWWDSLGLPALIHKIVGGRQFCSLLSTCICIPLNFILNKLLVFRGKKDTEKESEKGKE